MNNTRIVNFLIATNFIARVFAAIFTLRGVIVYSLPVWYILFTISLYLLIVFSVRIRRLSEKIAS